VSHEQEDSAAHEAAERRSAGSYQHILLTTDSVSTLESAGEDPATGDHGYRIADAHAHIYPEKIAEKATRAVGAFYSVEMAVRKGSPEQLLENGSRIGCSRYLVCSVATSADQVSSITDYIAEQCAAHPEFVGLGAYHQDIADPTPVLDHVQELGLRGIKLHPDFQRFDIDDPRMLPFYRECARRGLIVLFHMGDNRYDFSAPSRLVNVLDRVPDLRCIAAHLGGYMKWEDSHLLEGSDVYFDTSSSLWWLEPDQAASLIELFGYDKVMFGVDFPMWNHSKELDRFLGIGLSRERNQAILYDNFARLFGLE